MKMSKMKNATITPDLALVVIARNEERCIARCLNSARPFVSRMVVLDTGSTDNTMAIAREHGAKVYQAIWTDDFSAARNRALELADAEWNLILDADELIESGGECLQFAVNSIALGMVCICSDFKLDGQAGQDKTWITRLLPRGVQYNGRIHEQPISNLPRQRLPLVLGHDGYMAEQKKAKLGRNLRLLTQELQLHPEDSYLLYQMGKELETLGDHDRACEYYLQASASLPAGSGYEHELLIRTLHTLGQARRLEQAIALAESHMSSWSDSPDFFFVLGNLLLDTALIQPDQAQDHWLPMAEAAWLHCLEIGERPDLSGSVSGRGSYLAAHNLAAIYQGMGDTTNGEKYMDLAEKLRSSQKKS